MIILGLDPGLRHTGWGVIKVSGNQITYIADGTVNSDEMLSLGERLAQLYEGLKEVLATYHPQTAAIEETFVNQNPRSTLKLGQARGAVILAPALAGIPVAEYSPNLIKKSVVGVGHAEKNQIQMMLKILLPGCKLHSADSADALAVAITHARFQKK